MPSDAATLEHDCEAAELAAVRSWNEALPPSVSATLGTGHRSIGGGFLVHAAADVLIFNRVLGLGVASPASERDLDDAITHFTRAGARRFMVQVAPHAEPAELVSWLAARGFHQHNHWIRLTRDLTPASPKQRTDLRVAIIGREYADRVG